MALGLRRNGGKLELSIKIPSELETFFKTLSENNTETSRTWLSGTSGQKFYKLADSWAKIQTALQNHGYNIYNDYGDGIVQNGRAFNIAPLRTVGASEGVVITADKFADMPMIDFELYVKKLGEVTKILFTEFVAQREVKAVITFTDEL